MTEEIEPELAALAKTLELRFALHVRGRGHTYGYAIHENRGGRRVGSKSVWRGKENGKKVEHIVFTMGDAEFETALAFLTAYRQRLRDEEFEAAAPKEKSA